MNTSTRIIALVLVFLAIVLGILAFVVGHRPIPTTNIGANAAPSIPTYPVVIAARPLDAGQPIAGDAVRVVQLPVTPTGAFTRTEDVIGHVPRVAIPNGLPLTANGLNQGLPLTLKTGERGVAIPVDEVVGVGNAVQAGDYVDVFYSARAPGDSTTPQGTDRSVARLLLARIRVLSYGGDSLAPSTASGGGSAANRDAMHAQARSAVLAVPVADVDQLVLAAQSGKLTLALRYPEDQQVPDSGLFASEPRVLRIRNGLSAEQETQLNTPENMAYAGVDSLSLVGQVQGSGAARAPVPLPSSVLGQGSADAGSPRQRPPRAGPVSEGFVEVIRGADIKQETPNSSNIRDARSMPAAVGPAIPAGVSP